MTRSRKGDARLVKIRLCLNKRRRQADVSHHFSVTRIDPFFQSSSATDFTLWRLRVLETGTKTELNINIKVALAAWHSVYFILAPFKQGNTKHWCRLWRRTKPTAHMRWSLELPLCPHFTNCFTGINVTSTDPSIHSSQYHHHFDIYWILHWKGSWVEKDFSFKPLMWLCSHFVVHFV